MAEKIGIGRVSSAPADEEDMARIREILFGDQTRESSNRMARIESLLSAQDTALRELLDMRIARATKELHDELSNRDRRQAAALDALDAEFRARSQANDERLTLLDGELQDARHQVEQSLGEVAGSLNNLQQDNIDRAQLAEMFEGLAQHLRKTPAK
jgi:hypothetical protein